ncbi:MAG: VCBS repeat-containing protein [Desulfuromonadaceae bacterium]|nr:VCBS repeat-containing protein [Desulfuromonadaceae bacterium]
MKWNLSVLTALVVTVALSAIAFAGPVKTHVAEFAVTGAPNSQELKVTLQGILSSRLSPDIVTLVEKPDQAEFLVIGSYALFGKMFSMDILIKNTKKDSVVKVFEQGGGEEDVIPAIDRLAEKINAKLLKNAAIAVPAIQTTSTAAVQPAYILPTEPSSKNTSDSWSSPPLEGVFSSIATGRVLHSDTRELFIAGDQTIRAYLINKNDFKPIAETTIPAPGKILAIDTADLDKDGIPELFVTVIDREKPASRVYQFNGTGFAVVAENLPWFFRGIGTSVSSRKIYAQEIENGGSYYGDVKELSKSAAGFTTTGPQKLPRIGNIFNFILLGNTSQNDTYVVLDEDGYLVVHSSDGAEVWKSSDKFGGSELFFNSKPRKHARLKNDLQRRSFLEQRITILKDGTLLVPRNEGSFSFGNNRSYDKYALYGLEWNGAVLKEKWHTRTSPGYLADYAFDQASGEIFLLEVVKKSGIFSSGKSVVSITRLY